MAALAHGLRWLLSLAITARLAVWAFCIGLIVLAISPRSTIVVLSIAVLIGLSLMIAQDLPAARWVPLVPPCIALLLLAGWGSLSALWSPNPINSLAKAMLLGGIVAGTALAMQATRHAPPRLLHAALAGAVGGYAIAVAAITFEVVSDQWLARTVLQLFPRLQEGLDKHVFLEAGRVVRLSEAELNRRICMATLLLLPMLVALREVLPRRWHDRASIALLAGFAVVLPLGTHQSSFIAILAGGAIFAVATWQRVAIVRMLSVGWIAAAMLVVPVTAGLYNAEFHSAGWLFKSARERIVIWGTTADAVRERPWRGIGADATPAARDKESSDARVSVGEFKRTVGAHAHNAFLQIWFEVGGIGAVLFGIAGLLCLRLAADQPGREGLAWLAQFAVLAVMLAFSYAIWQAWFTSAIAFSLIVLDMSLIVSRRQA